MDYHLLYKIAGYLLCLGFLGHTFGGMLGTAKKGVGAGPEADEVLAKMKSVGFVWRGGKCTWYGFWLGNGLGVSALILPLIMTLLTLGGLEREQIAPFIGVAWFSFLSLALLTLLGFKYFVSRIGIVFGLIAVLVGIANYLVTVG
jgi:hypothetical protein